MNKTQRKFVILSVFAFLIMLINTTIISAVFAAPTAILSAASNPNAVFAATAAVIGSGWAAAYAISKTGSAAIATLAENEGGFFKAFLIVTLAETIAIYGLIVALVIIMF